MKQINTLIIVTDLTLGGIQNYVRASAKMLHEMNHKVFVIAINEANLFDTIEVISLKNEQSYKKPLLIKRFIKDYDIHLIIDHRTKSNFLKQKVYDVLLKSTPKIQFIHSTNFEMYFYKYKALNKIAYKNTSLFISVSKHINELVQQQINSKYDVLYHFFEENETNDNQNEKKDILFVGRFENEVKDLNFLLNAYLLSGLYKKNVKFHFVGAGKDKNFIEQFAERNSLENFIIIHPAVDDLSSFYQNAKIVVLASHFEGFPLVLMEAIYYGTPVLTTSFNPSVHELVKNDYNGIIVNKNLVDFSASLQKIFSDIELYDSLVKNTLALDENFSKNEAKHKWKIIFEALFKNRST